MQPVLSELDVQEQMLASVILRGLSLLPGATVSRQLLWRRCQMAAQFVYRTDTISMS